MPRPCRPQGLSLDTRKFHVVHRDSLGFDVYQHHGQRATINAVFDVPARLTRAMNNQPEKQSAANLLIPSVEDKDASVNPRHFPRVLVDGSDSCGVFTALIRVPLNIGTYFEEWRRTSNPIIGFAHRRPFSVAVCQARPRLSRTWKSIFGP